MTLGKASGEHWGEKERSSEVGTQTRVSPASLLGGRLSSRCRVVLGPKQPSHYLMVPGGKHNMDFYVEALAFPDTNFPGLITLTVSMLDTSKLVGREGSPASGA